MISVKHKKLSSLLLSLLFRVACTWISTKDTTLASTTVIPLRSALVVVNV